MNTPYPKGSYIVNEDGERRKVFEEHGDLRLVSIMQSTDPEHWETTVAAYPFHILELKRDGWVIERKESGPKDEWPKVGDGYWFFAPDGLEHGKTWQNDWLDQAAINALGIYRTREEAQAALRICQEALRKAGMME